MANSVSDYILERLTPIYGVATEVGPDAGSVQELLKRWWAAEGNTGVPTGQLLYNRYVLAGAVGSSLQDLAYDFWSRGLLKSALHFDEQYVYFDGTTGNYASTPDSAGLSITGDIDLRAKIQPDNWVPVGAQTIIAKDGSSGDKGWYFYIHPSGGGVLGFGISVDGTGINQVFASKPHGLTGSSVKWARVTRVAATGACTFYLSDDGVTWTSLGVDTKASGNFIDTVAVATIASHASGTSELFAGKVYYAEIRNGIGGTIVASFTANNPATTAVRTPASFTSFTSTEVWTINGAAWSWGSFSSPVSLASTPDSVINSVTGDIDIRVKCASIDWSVPGQYLLDKRDGAGGYQFRFDKGTTVPTRMQFTFFPGSGGSPIFRSCSATLPAANGVIIWIRATLDVDDGSGQNVTTFYTSTDGLNWTVLGAPQIGIGVVSIGDSTSPLSIGRTNSGFGKFAGEIYYVEVRNGIEGPIVAKFDASTVQTAGQQLPTTLNGWTWNGSVLYQRDDYVKLPGANTDWLSYPGSAANTVTGDIDIRIKASSDWATGSGPTANNRTMICQHGGGGLIGWEFRSRNGDFYFEYSLDGSSSHSRASTAHGLVDGAIKWIRFTRVQSTGVGVFYMSDDGANWTILSTATPLDVGSPFFGQPAQPIRIGKRGDGLAWPANVYYAEVRSGIDGPVVASFDARTKQTPWTIAGSGWAWQGANVPAPPSTALSLPGITGSGNFLVTTPDSLVTSIVGDIDIRAKITTASMSAAMAVVAKESGLGRSYRFFVNATGSIAFAWSVDGTNVFASPSSSAGKVVLGQTIWIRATLDVDNGAGGYVFSFYTSPDGVAWTLVGTGNNGAGGITSIADTTALVEIGSRFGNSSDPFNGSIHYAEIRNGIDGPIVAKFDAAAVARLGTRLPAAVTQVPGGDSKNFLTPNQASGETDASGWSPGTNTPTIASDATQFLDGVKSISMTATAAGPATMNAVNTPNNIAVVPGKGYKVKYASKADTVGRATGPQINWYNNAPSYLSTFSSSQLTNDPAVWTSEIGNVGTLTVGMAPALAAFGQITLYIPSNPLAGEKHFFDRISFREAETPWTLAGSAWDWVAA